MYPYVLLGRMGFQSRENIILSRLGAFPIRRVLVLWIAACCWFTIGVFKSVNSEHVICSFPIRIIRDHRWVFDRWDNFLLMLDAQTKAVGQHWQATAVSSWGGTFHWVARWNERECLDHLWDPSNFYLLLWPTTNCPLVWPLFSTFGELCNRPNKILFKYYRHVVKTILLFWKFMPVLLAFSTILF